MAVLHFLSIINFVDYFIYRYSNMARLTRAWEYIPSKDWTQMELEDLKKIINKHDNVKNFSEEEKDLFDISAENIFDEFFLENWNNKIKPILSKKLDKNQKIKEIETLFKKFLIDIIENEDKEIPKNIEIAIIAIKQMLNKEYKENTETTINLTKLELNVLQDDIMNFKTTEDGYIRADKQITRKQAFEEEEPIIRKTEKEKKIEERQKKLEEKELEGLEKPEEINWQNLLKILNPEKRENYKNNSYINHKEYPKEKKELKDIYKDDNTEKALKGVFDTEKFNKNSFKLNLSVENWLTWLFLQIQEQAKRKNLNQSSVKEVLRELYPLEAWFYGEITKDEIEKFLWELKGKNWFEYKNIKNNDISKIADIFDKMSRDEMTNFLNLMQSRPNIARVSKEWYNSKLFLDKGFVDEKNIFEFLSDINWDWMLSADYTKNKEQFKYWDIGNFSWSQIYFTIEQAVKSQEWLLWSWEWEKLVIQNIAKMIGLMSMANTDNPNPILEEYIALWLVNNENTNQLQIDIKELQENPTKANLLALLKTHPYAKSLFISSIERISGWAWNNIANLTDVLVGKESSRFENDKKSIEEEKIRNTIDAYIKADNWKLKKLIDEYWETRVKASIFQKIMSWIDELGVAMFFDEWAKINGIGVSKRFNTYEDFRSYLISKFQTASIGATTDWWIYINYNLGNIETSADLTRIKTKTNNFWIKISISELLKWSALFYQGWLEKQRQTNYQKLSNTSLTDALNQPAKYFWVGWAAWVSLWVGASVYAWVEANRERQYITGIVQMERLYASASDFLFDLDWLKSFDRRTIDSKLKNNLNKLSINDDFVKNNKNKLEKDLEIAVNFLDKSSILNEINDSELKEEEKKDAIISILNIIQQWAIEQRKSDLFMNLHTQGIKITKFGLWAGVWISTNLDGIFGWWFNKKNKTGSSWWVFDWSESPNLISDISDESDAWKIGWLSARFTQFAFVKARFSSRRTSYLPNQKQYLIADQKINEGKADNILEAGTDLGKYAKWMEWFLNLEWLTIEKKNNNDGGDKKEYLEIDFKETWVSRNLTKILDINYQTNWKTEYNFILQWNKLKIFDVGQIAVYVTSDSKWVYRTLCLWWTKPNWNHLEWNEYINPDERLKYMTFEKDWFEYFDKNWLNWLVDWLKLNKTENPDHWDIEFFKELFDKEWKLIDKPKGVTYQSWLLAGKQFNTGTLTLIKETDDNEYFLNYSSTPADKLQLNLEVVDKFEQVDNHANPQIDITINWIMPDIKRNAKLEYNQSWLKPKFWLFMEAVVNWNLEDAKTNLLEILGTWNNETSESIEILNWKDNNQKQNIIDFYTNLFAYETSYNNKPLVQILLKEWRGNAFIGLEWPSKKWFDDYSFGDWTTLKDEIKNAKIIATNNVRSENYSITKKETPTNLLWYTAFYRKWLKSNKRWFAGTRIWATEIIRDSKTYIKENKEYLAKERIADNLNYDTSRLALVKKQIQEKLPKNYKSIPLLDDDIVKLIKWEEIEKSLDNDGKKYIKISLESKAIFYFLAECVNESIWIELNNIIVKENIKKYAKEWIPKDKYKSHFNWATTAISSSATVEESRVNLLWWVSKTRDISKNKTWDETNTEWWTHDWDENPEGVDGGDELDDA